MPPDMRCTRLVTPYIPSSASYDDNTPPEDTPTIQPLYPTTWAWDEGISFSIIQTDARDVLDQQTHSLPLKAPIHNRYLSRY